MYNLDESIEGFARSSFNYGLLQNYPVYMSTKNTILKQYDGRFIEIFQRVFDAEFKAEFDKRDLWYEHRLIDDMVAQAIKSKGGFVWACKNYDGDVQSDIVAQGFGSLGFDDICSAYAGWKNGGGGGRAWYGDAPLSFASAGQATSTNPIASIFAWTSGLKYRGKFDENQPLIDFAQKLEEVVIGTVEDGDMTKDLALLVGADQKWLTTQEFLDKLREI